jgi:hypothetical protein
VSKTKNTVESLVKGGLIGAALGAWFSKDKDEGALVGAILGAIVAATFKANNESRQSNIPIVIEEGNKLYRLLPNGTKEFIKDLPKAKRVWPQHFTLHKNGLKEDAGFCRS